MFSWIQNNRTVAGFLAILFLAVALPIGWWLGSPLWRTDSVNEEFPFDLPTVSEAEAMSDEELESTLSDVMDSVDEMTEEEKEIVEDQLMELSAVMPDKEMNDDMADMTGDEWVIAAAGMFVDADAFHQGSGSATIFQQGDQQVLRLEDFEVTNGPDLHVILVENIDATSGRELGQMVDLGSLKGNVGNQNYEIPADIDLSQFEGVMIYCVPFSVIFSTASFN